MTTCKYYLEHRQQIIEKAKDYYHTHKNDSVWIQIKRAYFREYQKRLKLETFSGYAIGGIICCAHCGIQDVDVLQIDHVNGGGNKQRRALGNNGSGIPFYRWLKKNGFPDDYQVLCANCNVKKWKVAV